MDTLNLIIALFGTGVAFYAAWIARTTSIQQIDLQGKLVELGEPASKLASRQLNEHERLDNPSLEIQKKTEGNNSCLFITNVGRQKAYELTIELAIYSCKISTDYEAVFQSCHPEEAYLQEPI